MMATTRNQFLVWAAGSATGGPNHVGRHPITQPDGTTILVPCPTTFGSGGGGLGNEPAFITVWSGQSNMSGTQVDKTVSSYVAGSIGMSFTGGTDTGISPFYNANGTFSFNLEANAGNNTLQVTGYGASGTGPTTMDIDDITIVVAS